MDWVCTENGSCNARWQRTFLIRLGDFKRCGWLLPVYTSCKRVEDAKNLGGGGEGLVWTLPKN